MVSKSKINIEIRDGGQSISLHRKYKTAKIFIYTEEISDLTITSNGPEGHDVFIESGEGAGEPVVIEMLVLVGENIRFHPSDSLDIKTLVAHCKHIDIE